MRAVIRYAMDEAVGLSARTVFDLWRQIDRLRRPGGRRTGILFRDLILYACNRLADYLYTCFRRIVSVSLQSEVCACLIFVTIADYVLLHFGWSETISSGMMGRVNCKSSTNPFDIEKLRDFNIFSSLTEASEKLEQYRLE